METIEGNEVETRVTGYAALAGTLKGWRVGAMFVMNDFGWEFESNASTTAC